MTEAAAAARLGVAFGLLFALAAPPLAEGGMGELGMFKTCVAPGTLCRGGGRGGPPPCAPLFAPLPAPGSAAGCRMTEFLGC